MIRPCGSCKGKGCRSDGSGCPACSSEGETEHVHLECEVCGEMFWRVKLYEDRRIRECKDGPYCDPVCSSRSKNAPDKRAPVLRNDPDQAAWYLEFAAHPEAERLAMMVANGVRNNRDAYLSMAEHGKVGNGTLCTPTDTLDGHDLTLAQKCYIMRAGLLLSGTPQGAGV